MKINREQALVARHVVVSVFRNSCENQIAIDLEMYSLLQMAQSFAGGGVVDDRHIIAAICFSLDSDSLPATAREFREYLFDRANKNGICPDQLRSLLKIDVLCERNGCSHLNEQLIEAYFNPELASHELEFLGYLRYLIWSEYLSEEVKDLFCQLRIGKKEFEEFKEKVTHRTCLDSNC